MRTIPSKYKASDPELLEYASMLRKACEDLKSAQCRLQAEWAPLWETSGYHLSGCGADCSTTLGIKPVRRLDSRPLRDCRADQGRIDSLSGPGPMFR